MSSTGKILEIQRMSTEDGPGIRSTVFLKGCRLACTWCHNPESISSATQVVWHDWRCIGCRSCIDVCPRSARSLDSDGMHHDNSRCIGYESCGLCLDACPTLALETLGRRVTVAEVVDEVIRDVAYYDASDGGVTLSGGEPVLQAPFAIELARELRDRGVHVALDTCGMCSSKALQDVAAEVDLVLYDLKLADNAEHERYTGQENTIILENFAQLIELLRRSERRIELWVRTPLVPNATATEENITALGELLAQTAQGLVSRWDLCAFNNLCRDKYRRLDFEWKHAETELLSAAELEHFADVARRAIGNSQTVRTSGAVKIKDPPNTAEDHHEPTHAHC